MLFFGICSVLYFLKLLAGCGYYNVFFTPSTVQTTKMKFILFYTINMSKNAHERLRNYEKIFGHENKINK